MASNQQQQQQQQQQQPYGSKPPQVAFQPQPQPPPYTQQPQQQQPQPQSIFYTLPTQKFEDIPLRLNCPHCSFDVTTNVEFKSGGLTWLVAGGICLLGAPLGLFLGCCLIPFCVDSLKDAEHTCPKCEHVVGKYKRLG